MARMNVLAEVAKGLKANIHAVDNLSPVSRVAVYIKAGSRYEPNAVPGISHFLRASAGITTQDSSIFGLTRHLERAGASFKVTSDREYIVYRVDCLRDKLGHVLGFIDDTIHKPEFRSWELVDVVQPRLHEELKRYRKNQLLVANEATHKAAFRGGLAHSVFIPEHQIEKIKNKDLFEFVENNYVLDNMSFVGLGVDENELRQIVEEQFKLNGSQAKGVDGKTRYVGGEARIQANFDNTLLNYVVQGCPISNLKGVAALEVVGALLGGCQQTYMKYGAGPQHSLGYLLSPLSPSLKSSIININHTDTGLFGFSISGPNEKLHQATKAAVKHVKQVVTNLNENDFKIAQKVAIARTMISSENQETVYNNMGRRYAAGVISEDNSKSLIERLTLKEVQAIMAGLMKSKPTLVSVGNPRYVPYLDEIDS